MVTLGGCPTDRFIFGVLPDLGGRPTRRFSTPRATDFGLGLERGRPRPRRCGRKATFVRGGLNRKGLGSGRVVFVQDMYDCPWCWIMMPTCDKMGTAVRFITYKISVVEVKVPKRVNWFTTYQSQ